MQEFLIGVMQGYITLSIGIAIGVIAMAIIQINNGPDDPDFK